MIAREVRRHRIARKLSVRQLSDAVERRGLAMAQPVLSNLELGRRETISVAEWLVLAAALQVPPLALLFPVGRVDVVEPVPGFEVSPLIALTWAETGRFPAHAPTGDDEWPPTPRPVEPAADKDARLIERYRRHRELIGAWQMADGKAEAVRRHWSGDERDAELARLESEQRVTAGALRDLRELLRSQELTPPELPRSYSSTALRQALGEDDGEVEPS